MDELIAGIALEAAGDCPVFQSALRPPGSDGEAVYGQRVGEALAPGVERIHEAYLLHYGQPRAFAPAGDDEALLLGDYLYAAGLVRVCATGDLAAVAALADLIAGASVRRAAGEDDGALWDATVRLLARDRESPS